LGRRAKQFDSIRALEREGILPKGFFAKRHKEIIVKQRFLELAQANNTLNAHKFANKFRRSDGTWESGAERIFVRQMDRIGLLRQRINTLRQLRGLKPKTFPSFKY